MTGIIPSGSIVKEVNSPACVGVRENNTANTGRIGCGRYRAAKLSIVVPRMRLNFFVSMKYEAIFIGLYNIINK